MLLTEGYSWNVTKDENSYNIEFDFSNISIYNMKMKIDFSRIISKDGYKLDTEDLFIDLVNKIIDNEAIKTISKYLSFCINCVMLL